MNKTIEVLSFAELENLEKALARFGIISQEILLRCERQINQGLEELEQRLAYRNRQIERWRNAYEEAEDDDERNSIARKLEEAEESYKRTLYHRRLLKDQQQSYLRHAKILKDLATDESVKARHFLKKKLDALQEYLAVQFDGGVMVIASIQTTAGLSGGHMAPSESRNKARNLTAFSLPEGFTWVLLTEIDFKEIPGDLKYEKTSADQMRSGFDTLKNTILPSIQEDNSRKSNYFGEQDREFRRDYHGGGQRVYDAFFGHDHIRLERWEGSPTYSITNGRHRINIARELGWAAVPGKTVDVSRRK